MRNDPPAAFLTRLRDLLSTVESAAVISNAEARVRGLREQLQFACVAVPCDEAFVALELEAFGRLHVPVVVTAHGARDTNRDVIALGTPFAHLLAGGDAHAMSLAPGDAMIAALGDDLVTVDARSVVLAPVRIGAIAIGGVALFRVGESGEREVQLAQQLGEVLSLTVRASAPSVCSCRSLQVCSPTCSRPTSAPRCRRPSSAACGRFDSTRSTDAGFGSPSRVRA